MAIWSVIVIFGFANFEKLKEWSNESLDDPAQFTKQQINRSNQMIRKLIAWLITAISLAFSFTSFSTDNTVASTPTQKVFVGTWERFSFTDVDGKPKEDRFVRAHLIFTADGHYSQTLLPAGRDKSNKPLKEMTKEELLKRFEGTEAMYGTYSIAENKLIRKKLTNLNPNAEGQEFVQIFRFEGDVLILTLPRASTFEARFRRVK
jgi:lipocalin-like protein